MEIGCDALVGLWRLEEVKSCCLMVWSGPNWPWWNPWHSLWYPISWFLLNITRSMKTTVIDWADFKNGCIELGSDVREGHWLSRFTVSLFLSFPGCLAGQIPDLEYSAHPHLLCLSWWQQWRCRWNYPVWQLWGDCAWRWVNFLLSHLSPEL